MLPLGMIASQLSKQQLQITTNYSVHFKYISVIKQIYFHLFWEMLGSTAESCCLLTSFKNAIKNIYFPHAFYDVPII